MKMIKTLGKSIVVLIGVSFFTPAFAVLEIEITQGVQGAAPIAVVPFAWEGTGTVPVDVAGIVSNDLSRSGKFSPMARDASVPTPTNDRDIRFDVWKTYGMDHLVIGRLRAMGPGSYVVQFQLFDVFKGQQIVGYSFPASGDTLRRVAHNISDIIYEKILGERGAFNTLIAYVTAEQTAANKLRYMLHLADSDGHDQKTILTSQHPIMSPAWSPDSKRLAYVSFEKRVPAIYVQDWLSSQREKISSVKGINGAPAWSPDGQKLALTLSHEGNPDIYVLDIHARKLSKITRSSAIDTEPAWMPDGRSVVFTSDRSGNPQLYQKPIAGGRAKRLTFEGKYNTSPSVSPDGKHIAMVHAESGNYQIAVLELETESLRILTDGRLDESPSFAPNGSMILYATQGGGRGVLVRYQSTVA